MILSDGRLTKRISGVDKGSQGIVGNRSFSFTRYKKARWEFAFDDGWRSLEIWAALRLKNRPEK
jgi:hypothetical protein